MIKVKDNYIFSFSKNNKAVTHCKDKDTIVFDCLDCYGKDANGKQIINNCDNPATGPVYIDGLKKGDVLKVEIQDIKVASSGTLYVVKGCGILADKSKAREVKLVNKDDKVKFNKLTIETKPMIGVIGLAPKGKSISCVDSFNLGGNMDCPSLTKGTTIYLPCEVDGGLLACGDLHTIMGEGEIIGTGIETAGQVKVKVTIIKNKKLDYPLLETKDAYYALTYGINCNVAIERGFKQLRKLIKEVYCCDDTEAAMYLALIGLVRGNQTCMSKTITYDNQGPTFSVGIRKVKGSKKLI